jgi:fructose-specific phosphotransferase system IIA component
VTGTVIGIGGVVVSFFFGAVSVMLVLGVPFGDPRALLLGVICTATSVGITTRVFSERRKIDSPEGVTVLAGAVVDDILGIILLAVILGITLVSKKSGTGLSWVHIGFITVKALVVWIGFTALGLVLARKISAGLKLVKGVISLSVLALGLALILAGIFEKAGLAMIIGAYVMGLSLSKSDLRYVVLEHLQPIHTFLVPLFFTVMGMLLNPRVFLSGPVLLLGITFSIGAIIAKLVGCGIPSLFLNFNRLGALRIGLGMAPRSEVALIIAGAGLSYGLLDSPTFGAALMMPLVTALVTPPLLDLALKRKERGTRKDLKTPEKVATSFNFPSVELTDFLMVKITSYFQEEGYFIHRLETDHTIYHFARDTSFITLHVFPSSIAFYTRPDEVAFVRTIVYEALVNLHEVVDKLKTVAKPVTLRKEVADQTGQATMDIKHVIDPSCICLDIAGDTKEAVITQLIDVLAAPQKLKNRDQCLQAVLDRENAMSTGMQHGIALPHGKTAGVETMAVAVGIKKEGLEFQSIDGQPSTIFILIVSPLHTTGPHIRFLATISAILNNEDIRKKVLNCTTPDEVCSVLTA